MNRYAGLRLPPRERAPEDGVPVGPATSRLVAPVPACLSPVPAGGLPGGQVAGVFVELVSELLAPDDVDCGTVGPRERGMT